MHFTQSAAIALATVLYASAQVQANDVFAHFMVGFTRFFIDDSTLSGSCRLEMSQRTRSTIGLTT